MILYQTFVSVGSSEGAGSGLVVRLGCSHVSEWIDAIGAKWEARLQRLKDFVENDDEPL
jgi:hypothetical protein